jgi:hypothetical protein
MSQCTIIYEGSNLLVISKECDIEAQAVFVLFNESAFRPNGTQFWGDQLVDKLPIAGIGVVSKSPNWYPEQEMRDALPAMRTFIQKRPVITYGYSQGGYGALKYASALGACGTLSFSPQISINPESVPFDNRFIQHYSGKLSNGEKVLPSDVARKSFVFYDPYEKLDCINAEMLTSYPGVEGVICPFVDHGSVRQITESGVSSAFLESAIKMMAASFPQAEITRTFRSIIRTSRRNSLQYKKGLTNAILSKRDASTVDRLLKSDFLQTGPKIGAILDWQLLLRRGSSQDINQWILKSSQTDLSDVGLVTIWNYARAHNLVEAELRVALLILETSESDPFLLLHPINSYMTHGNRNSAKMLLADLVVRFGVRDHTDHIRNFATQLGLKGLLQILSDLA